MSMSAGWPVAVRTAVAVFALGAAVLGDRASAQGVDLSSFFKETRPLDHPKPWPLRTLVTPGTLTVGITAKTPPSSFTNTRGEFDGSRIKLFKQMATDLGLKIEFVRLDWPGILPGLTANKFDIACEGASWSNERLASPDFRMSRPVAANATIGIVRKDSGIKSWQDVDGKRLSGVKGELYYASAQKAVKSSATVDLPGRPEGILALLNRQADVFAVDVVAAESLLKNSPRGGELTIIGPPLDLLVQSMCINKNAPDLLQAVNHLITNYRITGQLDKWETEFFGTDQHVKLLSVVGY
ncbi:MAG: transporter substrate-binding domain-containing protein [Alphaproteobacteria bacterium]|nr:transporter substrate-binding domain-containing protein [Alphaproteobacteria bacterium]